MSEWIKYLPEARQQLPDIKLQYAYSLIPYQEEEAFGLFCDLYEQALNLGNITLAYDAWTGLADCSFYNLNRFGELKDWLVHITQLLKKEPLPTEEKSRNAFVAAYFNALLFCAPDKKKLIEWQSKAHSALNKSTNPETRTLLSNHLILVSIWQGDMFQARLLSKEFLGVDSLQNQNPLAFMVQKTMQSQVAWLNADKPESLRYVKEGLDYSQKSKIKSFDAQLTAQAVYACMVDNDFKMAETYLKKLEKIKNPHHVLDNGQYHYLRAWVSASTDDIGTAYIHAKRAVELTKLAGVEFAESATRTLLAQIHFEKNNLIRALHHLARVQMIGRKIGSLHIRFAGLLAQSWAMFHFNRQRLALRYLRKAFQIGAQQEYLHIPGWPYKIMSYLCEVALEESIEPEYVKRLIRLHQIPPSSPLDAPDNWPWKVQIKLFGSFKLFLEGVEWVPNRKSQQRPLEILKLLAFHCNGIHQEKLADILWKDAEGDSVIQTLHTTLHRLRKLLNSHDAITLKNGLLCLNPKLVQVDINHFKKLSQEKLSDQRAHLISQQLYQLCEQGLLSEESEAQWIIPVREEFKSHYLNFLYRYSDFMEKKGEINESIKSYEHAILLDKYSEKNYQKLISFYLHEGLNAEAIHLFERCAAALQERFNISPSLKTSSLISEL